MQVVAEVVRSGFVESRHRGVAVRLDASGEVQWAVGDPDTEIFPRSANKPLQAMGLLRAGLPLEGGELALAMSSHSAEPMHLAGVRGILARAGLDESALQTPASYPLDPKVHADVLRAGGVRMPIYMDCSGKHAAMLLTCVVNGWPTETYLADDHPVQRAIDAEFVSLTGATPVAVGVDGCGAPLLGCRLTDLARAIGTVRRGEAGEESVRLAGAWVEHPDLVSGTRRTESWLAARVPGLAAKSGAESVMVVGLADGTSLAVKIEDGGERALRAVTSRALELAGCDADSLRDRPVILGGGAPVGEIRTAF